MQNLPTFEELPPGSLVLVTFITQTILHFIGKEKKPNALLKLIKMACTVIWLYSIFNFRKYRK